MEYDADETFVLSSDEESYVMELEEDNENTTEVVAPLVTETAVQEGRETRSEPMSQSLLHVNTQDNVAAPEKPKQADVSLYDDDGATCPICLDSWTNYGEHRVCALKCGHLFGLHCIERWFAQRERTCPTCKKKATKCHIRHIYARKLVAIDTSEYENIKKELDAVNTKNNSLQIELTKGICKEHLLLQQVETLKKQVANLTSKIEINERFQQSQSEPRKSIRLYMDKSLEICKDAGCRVLDYIVKYDLIVASMKSPNALFPGFGVRKINISTYKPTLFVPLHSKSIRDLSIHPQNPWLLSVSLDKTLKVVDAISNHPICSYIKGEVPLWACCWDLHNSNILYVGSQQGAVSKFDMRYMSEPMSILEVPGDMSPVVSLAPVQTGSFISRGGVIVCKLNSVWVFENENDVRLPLPIEGPFISMKYQNATNHLLLSTRPNSNFPNSRHLLCTIEAGAEHNLISNVVHCFSGGLMQKYMSRSCFVEDVSDSYVAAHQESSKSVFLWSISRGEKVFSVPTRDPVLDLCSFKTGNVNFVVSLSEKKMEFFKFV